MVRGDKVTMPEEDAVEMGRVAFAVYHVLSAMFHYKFDEFVDNLLDPLYGADLAAGLLEDLRTGRSPKAKAKQGPGQRRRRSRGVRR